MRTLTQNIGELTKSKGKFKDPTDVKRILISRPNHRLGNLLLISPLVQEISDIFPNCKIDLFVKGELGPYIFKNYRNVDNIIQLPKNHFQQLFNYIGSWTRLKSKKYDFAINVVKTSSSGRLSTQFTNSDYKFFGDIEEDSLSHLKDYNHIAKYPVYNFRNYLNQQGIPVEQTREIPALNLKLDEGEVAEGKKTLEELFSKQQKIICIFTYATGVKIYSKLWWSRLHKELKTEFPSYNFLEILPVENVSQIDFKEPSFYSQDIRKIAAVIANTAIFIGADSGIMHLAASVQVPTLGLFHSNPETYSPYGNFSKSFNTTEKSMDELIGEVKRVLFRN